MENKRRYKDSMDEVTANRTIASVMADFDFATVARDANKDIDELIQLGHSLLCHVVTKDRLMAASGLLEARQEWDGGEGFELSLRYIPIEGRGRVEAPKKNDNKNPKEVDVN